MKKPQLLVGLGLLLIIVGISFYYFASVLPTFRTPLTSEHIANPFPIATPQPSAEPTTIELVFAGDIMLDRNIRLKAQQSGYDSLIGPQLKELLTSADYSIANLEGPVTSNQSVSVGSAVGSTRNFLFTFAPETTTFLKDHNIYIVNLGNNHILNFGTEGLSETYNFLDQGGLQYFGYTGETQAPDSSVYILEKDGNKIGFVNYNQFISGGEEQAFADIRKLRDQVDYLIMYTHWGNEYVPENQVLIDLAHRFVDEGVDLVIGSHPHVVTGHEVYKDKHIYYSLGNFIFDQYFEDAVKKGLVIKAVIDPETQETVTTEYPIYIDPATGTELVK